MWDPSRPWPHSSYPAPAPDPGSDPTVPPWLWGKIPPAWLQVILGSLQQLVSPSTWSGTAAEIADLQSRATDLIDQIAQAGATVPINFQHNDVDVASEPTLDVEDTASILATLVDDPTNNRVKLSLSLAHTVAPIGSTGNRAARGAPARLGRVSVCAGRPRFPALVALR